MIACGMATAKTIRADVSPTEGGPQWFSGSTFPYVPSFPLLSGINPGISGAPVLVYTERSIWDQNGMPGMPIYDLPIPQEPGFSMPQALSYDWPNTLSPTAQVQVYSLGPQSPGDTSPEQLPTPSGALVSVLGDTEVEFNYSGSSSPGVASFSYDGVKYQSSDTGNALIGDTNDFLFSSTGAFVGWVNSSEQVVANLSGSGWTASAPEMDPVSGLSALTLLAGSLAMARGRPRRPERTA